MILNLAEQLKNAIISPKKYFEMLEQSLSKKIAYIVTICIIVSMMTALIPDIAAIAAFGGFKNLFTERIPAFKVENGKLTSADNFDLNMGGVHFYVDTEQTAIDPEKLDGTNDLYFAFGSEEYTSILVQTGMKKEMYRFKVSEVLPDGMDNDSLVKIIPIIYISIVFQFVFTTIFVGVKYMLVCLIFSLPFSFLLKMAGQSRNTFDMLMLCFYADTLPILVIGVNQALGYIIPPIILSFIGIFILNRNVRKSLVSLNDNQDGQDDNDLFRR